MPGHACAGVYVIDGKGDRQTRLAYELELPQNPGEVGGMRPRVWRVIAAFPWTAEAGLALGLCRRPDTVRTEECVSISLLVQVQHELNIEKTAAYILSIKASSLL